MRYSTIRSDEIFNLKSTLNYLKILKHLKNKGYDIQVVNPIANDIDEFYGDFDTIFQVVMTIVVGKNNYDYYIATKEEGDKIGYNIITDDDECDVTVVQIKNKYIDKYMQILKENGLNVYDDEELNTQLNRIDVTGYSDCDNFTEGIFGEDYSGFYLITTFFDLDIYEFIEAYENLTKLCKNKIKDYYNNKIINLNRSIYEYTAKQGYIKKRSSIYFKNIKSKTKKQRYENRRCKSVCRKH